MSGYVTCFVAPIKKESKQLFFTTDELSAQETLVKGFLEEHEGDVLSTFVETVCHDKGQANWPELKAAISECERHQSALIIPELCNLTNNDSFCQIIMDAIDLKKIKELHCLDQPFINSKNFDAVALHAREQRKYHGKLIKAGIDKMRTTCPDHPANNTIKQVNRNKADNAILFSLLMMPVIYAYQQKGYSQRTMIQKLNEEGYTAPGGGKWVLSQFQKLLEKTRVNEAALSLEKTLDQYQREGISLSDCADRLNVQKVLSPIGKEWTIEVVKKVNRRKQELREISEICDLAIQLIPHLGALEPEEVTEEKIQGALKAQGHTLPQEWIN